MDGKRKVSHKHNFFKISEYEDKEQRNVQGKNSYKGLKSISSNTHVTRWMLSYSGLNGHTSLVGRRAVQASAPWEAHLPGRPRSGDSRLTPPQPLRTKAPFWNALPLCLKDQAVSSDWPFSVSVTRNYSKFGKIYLSSPLLRIRAVSPCHCFLRWMVDSDGFLPPFLGNCLLYSSHTCALAAS